MDDEKVEFIHYFEAGDDVTLLLLHGTGGTEHDLVGLGRVIAPGASILSPRGRVLENGMPRYFRRLQEGVFDIEDLHKRTEELADWISAITAEKEIDDRPIVALGFSNGANIAGSLLLSYPGLLAGAMLLRPMVPFVPDELPSLNGTRVLVGAGTHDQLIEPEETNRLVTLLQTCGASVDLYWQPGGHGLGQGDLDQTRAWFSQQSW